MLSAKNILVPTDFSPHADKALEVAVDIAKHNHAKVHLLHVVDVIQQCVADYCLPNATVVSLNEQIRSATDSNIKKAAIKHRKEGVDIIGDIKEGVPYEEILKEQKATKSDLIVMSAHGRSGFKKYLMGSVADKVMKGAPCNVVVVKS